MFFFVVDYCTMAYMTMNQYADYIFYASYGSVHAYNLFCAPHRVPLVREVDLRSIFRIAPFGAVNAIAPSYCTVVKQHTQIGYSYAGEPSADL